MERVAVRCLPTPVSRGQARPVAGPPVAMFDTPAPARGPILRPAVAALRLHAVEAQGAAQILSGVPQKRWTGVRMSV